MRGDTLELGGIIGPLWDRFSMVSCRNCGLEKRKIRERTRTPLYGSLAELQRTTTVASVLDVSIALSEPGYWASWATAWYYMLALVFSL